MKQPNDKQIGALLCLASAAISIGLIVFVINYVVAS